MKTDQVPSVSIITTAFNVGRYIEATIRSVAEQSRTDHEHIIVDDGSSDDTRRIIASLASADQRIKVVLHDRNLGASAARNSGLDRTSAPFVCFLDGDDTWESDFLDVMLSEIKSRSNSCEAVFCASRVIDESGRFTGAVHRSEPGAYNLARMLAGVCPPGNGSSLIIRRTVFVGAGLFDPSRKSGEETEMWLRMLEDSDDKYFWCIDRPLVRYRQRPGSLSKNHKSDRLASLEMRITKYIDRVRPEERWDIYAKYASIGLSLVEEAHPAIDEWIGIVFRADPLRLLAGGAYKRVALAALIGTRRYFGLYRLWRRCLRR
jgi:glycosyltransferase involved in cell wall biosynthesis